MILRVLCGYRFSFKNQQSKMRHNFGYTPAHVERQARRLSPRYFLASFPWRSHCVWPRGPDQSVVISYRWPLDASAVLVRIGKTGHPQGDLPALCLFFPIFPFFSPPPRWLASYRWSAGLGLALHCSGHYRTTFFEWNDLRRLDQHGQRIDGVSPPGT